MLQDSFGKQQLLSQNQMSERFFFLAVVLHILIAAMLEVYVLDLELLYKHCQRRKQFCFVLHNSKTPDCSCWGLATSHQKTHMHFPCCYSHLILMMEEVQGTERHLDYLPPWYWISFKITLWFLWNPFTAVKQKQKENIKPELSDCVTFKDKKVKLDLCKK